MAQVNMPQKKDGSASMFQAIQTAKTVYDMSNSGGGSPTTGAPEPEEEPEELASKGGNTPMHRRYKAGRTA